AWNVPGRLSERLIVDRYTQELERDFGKMYVRGYRANFSPEHRAEILNTYHQEFVRKRLFMLGGGLGFVLVCLAALSGYIRADEATKGYYTKRLRLVAAAAVGVSGVVAYRLISHSV